MATEAGKGGGLGCVGVGGLFALAIMAALAIARIGTGDAVLAGTASAREYVPFCASAIVEARRLAAPAGIAGASLAEPSVSSEGGRAVIVCAAETRRSGFAQVTARLSCSEAANPDCVKVTAVTGAFGTILLDAD